MNSNKNINLMLCYVSKDSEIVKKIVELIDNTVFDCSLNLIYMDKPGEGCANDWQVWSENSIQNSDIVLQIWTSNTMDSKDDLCKINDKVIRDELRMAREKGKQIIILDNVGDNNYAEGFNIASKTISKTYIKDFEKEKDLIINVVKDRIYKINNNIIPDYYKKQRVLKSNDALGSLGSLFVGRKKEIERIDDYFNSGKHIVVLSGEGGIGKTEIARHYAELKGDKGFICVKVCGDGNNDKLSSVIVSLDYENELSEEDNKKTDYEKALIRIKQLEDVDKRLILIIDNFNSTFDEGENRKIINKLSESVDFRIIFSSGSKTNNQAIGLINIEPLEYDDQLELFYERCNEGKYILDKNDENNRKILELSKDISGHTLTLELCARIINKKGRSVEEIRSTLLSTPTKIISEHTPEKMSIYSHLLTLFGIAGIDEEKKNVLYMLSFICPLGISDKDLCELLESNSNFDEYDDDIEYLKEIGLIKETMNGFYYLHSLVSMICFKEYDDGRQDKKDLIEHYLLNKYAPLPDDSKEKIMISKEYLLYLNSRCESASLNFYLGILYYKMFQINEALSFLSKNDIFDYSNVIESINQKDLKNLCELVGETYTMLISLCNLNGDSKMASEYGKKATVFAIKVFNRLCLLKEISITDYYYICNVTYRLLSVSNRLYESKDIMIKCYEKCLTLGKQENSIEFRMIIASFLCIIGSIDITMNDLEDALKRYWKAIYVLEAISEDKCNLAIKDLLVKAYSKIGDIVQGNSKLEYYKKALSLKIEMDDIQNGLYQNEEIAELYGKIAFCYSNKCDYDNARENYKKMLDVCGHVFRPMVCDAYDGLGNVARDLGQLKEALEYYKKEYDITDYYYNEKRNYGIYKQFARAIFNIGLTLYYLKDYVGAKDYLEKGLDLFYKGKKSIEIEDFGILAMTKLILAQVLIALNERAEAYKMAQDSKTCFERINDLNGVNFANNLLEEIERIDFVVKSNNMNPSLVLYSKEGNLSSELLNKEEIKLLSLASNDKNAVEIMYKKIDIIQIYDNTYVLLSPLIESNCEEDGSMKVFVFEMGKDKEGKEILTLSTDECLERMIVEEYKKKHNL